MVRNKTLLLLAGIVWLAAGFNITRIGVWEYAGNWSVTRGLCSAAVFAVFWFFVFGRLVRKHTARIRAYGDRRMYFWNFFDQKSFAVMAFMMALGIAVRAFHLMPDRFIAVFYTGLGLALALAGVRFAAHYARDAVFGRRRCDAGNL